MLSLTVALFYIIDLVRQCLEQAVHTGIQSGTQIGPKKHIELNLKNNKKIMKIFRYIKFWESGSFLASCLGERKQTEI